MPDSDAKVKLVFEGQRIGYSLSQSWVPLPPGITSLPAAPALVSDPTYGQVMTPTALLRPYQEVVTVDAKVRVLMAEQRLEYALTLPDRIDTFKVKAFQTDSPYLQRSDAIIRLVYQNILNKDELRIRAIFANQPTEFVTSATFAVRSRYVDVTLSTVDSTMVSRVVFQNGIIEQIVPDDLVVRAKFQDITAQASADTLWLPFLFNDGAEGYLWLFDDDR